MNSKDIIFSISAFMNDYNCVVVLTLNKISATSFKPELEKRRQARLFRWFPPTLHAYVQDIPQISISRRWYGVKSYLDTVDTDDMELEVVWGRDLYRRSFISVRHDRGVLTFFQKYTDMPNLWTTGGKYPTGLDTLGEFDIEKNWKQDELLKYLKGRLDKLFANMSEPHF